MVAVVEPAIDGDTTIELAQTVVDRGGRATVVVLMSRKTIAAIEAFADAEDLHFADAREMYIERLAADYSARFGGQLTVTIVTDRTDANHVVFEAAARDSATSVVMPQRLVNRRNWKTAVARSQIPVLIAPAA
jgi:hypothetical protein